MYLDTREYVTFVPAPSLHLIVLYYIQLWEFEYLF
jgi:hypothetical protein